jgi:hypothetical protein
MAKKKTQTAKSSPAEKAARKPAKKSPPAHHDQCDCCDSDIVLDDSEKKMIDRVLKSSKLRLALETEVSTALSAAVRRFCRQNGAALSAAQAQNVAMVLFGD